MPNVMAALQNMGGALCLTPIDFSQRFTASAMTFLWNFV